MIDEEVVTVPVVVFVIDGDLELVEAVRELLDAGSWLPLGAGDGYVVTPRANPDDATRARQARYRQRKRDARVAPGATRTRRVSLENASTEDTSPRSEGPGGGGIRRETAANDQDGATRRRDARDANDATVTRRALPDMATYRDDVVPLTESEREEAQARVRELSEQLRAAKSGGDDG